ncbi:MAG: hypothetical protein FWE41_02945 [Coriobacteriia bacterium]|nr:hypothetical protein [Coriobacteriia bacterium]MCL2750327.1 hypothetical protein [Coriobacteriia bacterium]
MALDFEESIQVAARNRDAEIEKIHEKRRRLTRHQEALESEASRLNQIESRVHETIENLSVLADDDEWRMQGYSSAHEFYYARQETQRLVFGEFERLEEEKCALLRREDECLHDYETLRAAKQLERERE